jgi:excinuclease UvrABC nuclease subunit
VLDVESLPVRIEGFDISNLGPDHTVASMVVFEGGAPKKSDYRRFKVRGDRTRDPDDFASVEEVLGGGPPDSLSRPTCRRTTPTATLHSRRCRT